MNFTVFSKDGCSYCEKVKKILELTSSKFVVYNLGEHFDEKAFTDEFGHGTTFPQVMCDGKKLGGTLETVEFLREQKIIAV